MRFSGWTGMEKVKVDPISVPVTDAVTDGGTDGGTDLESVDSAAVDRSSLCRFISCWSAGRFLGMLLVGDLDDATVAD
jgi:hypothetical protein